MERYENLAKICDDFGGEFTKKFETRLNVQSFHTHFTLKATSCVESSTLYSRNNTPRHSNRKIKVIKDEKKTSIDNSFLTTADTTTSTISKNTNFIIKSNIPTPNNKKSRLIFK